MPNLLRPPTLRRLAPPYVIALAVALATLAGIGGYWLSERQGVQAMRVEASHRLDLFAAAMDSVVNLYVHVPSTLELAGEVRTLLARPQDRTQTAATSRFLERLNAHIGSIAIFVIGRDGVVLAASNWSRPGNLIGEDLSVRPYFQTARRGETGRHYAIGGTRGDPGYFISHPIWGEGAEAGQVIGVAVIKIELGVLEESWLPLGTPALIADDHGVVLLTSVPDWRYKVLAPLAPVAAQEIERSRQFNNRPITPFPVALDADEGESGQVVRFPAPLFSVSTALHGSRDFLAQSRALSDTGWRLVIFSDLSAIRRQALSHAALAVAASGFVVLLVLYLAQRRRHLRQRLETQALLERANSELESKVAARTADLSAANERLQTEVAERERTEQTLREKQDDLVQAAKLAALGQLATGITHELAQPLGALRTLSGNAIKFMQRGDLPTAEQNLGIIGKLVDQMGGIIGPLKNFARKSPARPAAVVLGQALGSALFLLDQRLRQNRIQLDTSGLPPDLVVWCDQNRLEQVLVNLVGNAIDAMRQSERRELRVAAGTDAAGRIRISVADTGCGFGERAQDHLFEAFFTTKAAGEGLGLGLAISRDIVREFGGELSAANLPAGGAVFSIDLPPVPAETP
jgi:C4-dicarboxylate-specific signal transduction histidine kinase